MNQIWIVQRCREHHWSILRHNSWRGVKEWKKNNRFLFSPWTNTCVRVQTCEYLCVCVSLSWVPVLLSCPGAMEPAPCPYPAWTSTCTDWLLICREKEEVERQWLEKAAGGYERGPNGVLSSETQTESRRAVIHTEHTRPRDADGVLRCTHM